MKSPGPVFEVWRGDACVVPACAGLTKGQALGMALDQVQRGRGPVDGVEVRQAAPAVVEIAGNKKLLCTACGSVHEGDGRARFRKRHPKECRERIEFTRQCAQGTRHLDDLERR